MTAPPLRFFVAAAAALVLWPAAGPAQTYAYQWTNGSGTALGSTLSVNVGSTVTLGVYLTETSGTTTLTNPGLFSAGVRARYYDPSVAGTTPGVLTVVDTGSIVRNAAFDDAAAFTPTVSTPNYSQFDEAKVDPFTGVTATGNRVYLGSFTFQVGTTAGQSTVLTALDIPNQSDTVLAVTGTTIDPLVASRDLTVSTVTPEPAGVVAVGGLAVAGLAAVRRRRTRAAAAAKGRAG